MIFLLFLVSVAVIEYIVRQPPEIQGGGSPTGDKQQVNRQPAANAVPVAVGLHKLGDALDHYGRGEAPGAREVPKASQVQSSTGD